MVAVKATREHLPVCAACYVESALPSYFFRAGLRVLPVACASALPARTLLVLLLPFFARVLAAIFATLGLVTFTRAIFITSL